MNIHVEYFGPTRLAGGLTRETLDLPGPCSVAQAIQQLGVRHGQSLMSMLASKSTTTELTARATLLVFVNDQQESVDSTRALQDGETLVLVSPFAGG